MEESIVPKKRGISAYAAVASVTAYLVLVAAWLVLTRQIRAPGITRVVLAMLRPRYSGNLAHATSGAGHCYVAPLPGRLLSDFESASRLELFEDGRRLGPGHASHEDIRELGAGRYSHWGAQLYFSASDNSDPRRNGRAYTVRESRRWGSA